MIRFGWTHAKRDPLVYKKMKHTYGLKQRKDEGKNGKRR